MHSFFVRTTRLLALLVALFAGSGCSVVLKWDENNLPCDQRVVDGNTLFCLEGFTCQRQSLRCVRDASLGEGETCSLADQCKTGTVCPIDLLSGGGKAGSAGVQQCLASCRDTGTDGGFLQTAACGNRSEVCLPYLNAAASKANKALVGGCFPSAGCTPGETCSLNGVTDSGTCVVMGANNVTACMQGCEVSWSTTQAYSDNCDMLHGCVPVGVPTAQAFACMYNAQNSNQNPVAAVTGQSPAGPGEPCSPVLSPCGKGYVCSQGRCAQYCQLTTNQTFPCPTGQNCCPFSNFGSAQASGFCSTACN